MITKRAWQAWLIAVLALALLALWAGCNKAGQQDEEARIEGDFAQTADTASDGWKDVEHDVAADEGPVTAEELAASGENLPPDLTGESPVDPSAAGGIDGAEVYRSASCTMCHGEEREGTGMAPALIELNKQWQPGTLEKYLLDPEGYTATDERLREQAKQYSMQMPPWNYSAEEMAALINWLLEIKPVEEE